MTRCRFRKPGRRIFVCVRLDTPMGNIRKLLNPNTIALIGATEREHSLGRTLMENLLLSEGRHLFPVNPDRESILGLTCYPSIAAIPEHIDLAIIATRADTVPGFVEVCGKAGVDGIIIASAGFTELGPAGMALVYRITEIGKKYGVRIIGPNSMGIIRPNENLNTATIHANPKKGKTAFISQSEAFGRTLLDWGISAHMGFSMFASLGSMIDVDFADLIDFLCEDPQTKNIMIYVEGGIGDAKKFINAAKGCARNKPIIVLKPAAPVTEKAPGLTHTGLLVDTEHVYDAVFRRTGVVRVAGAVDLFDAASVLYAKHLPKGPKLLTITNAGGIGVMATNTLLERGGELVKLSVKSIEELRRILPSHWKKDYYLDILRDADVARFIATLNICLKDPGVDGVLIIFTPQGAAAPEELAEAVSCVAKTAWRPIVAAWMGGRDVQKGKEILLQNCIPTYNTPEEVVKTYLYMYNYRRNIALLYETPEEPLCDNANPNKNLKVMIRRAADKGVTVLTEAESMRLLTNYGIPFLKIQTAHSVGEAAQFAMDVGYPVVIKVSSPDIIFRLDVGGVVTGINTELELRKEYEKLIVRVQKLCPRARIEGVIVQKMLEKIDYEIIIGSKKDPTFGAVILFGMGGVAVDIFKDFSIALPPLNLALARRLMEESKVYKMLQGYRNKPPADLRQLEQIIVSFSNLIVDFPEIAESDMNPIAISNGKAYALDARIVLDKNCSEPTTQYPHLVITPYPTRYVRPWTLPDGRPLLLRPVKPEDAPLIETLYASVSEAAFYGRFFSATKQVPAGMCIRDCSVDYDREIGIVAEEKGNGIRKIAGFGMLLTEPGQKRGEYSILVHDDFQGQGLGYMLIDMLIGIAHEKGLTEIFGVVLASNVKMLNVIKMLGFTIAGMPDGLKKVSLLLE